MGSVNIELGNGGLGGTLQTNDGLAGMVLTGGIDGGGYVLGTPILVTGLASVTAAGITTDGNTWALRHITDFYDHAGDGAQLYLMLVPNSMTVAEMADFNEADGAKKLLDYAQGKIRLLAIMSDDDSVGLPTITDGLNEDVYTAITNLNVMATNFFDAKKPFRAIIGGTSYTGVAADLVALTTLTRNKVGVVIGDTVETSNAAMVGVVLGRAARNPVQRKISRVRDGALNIDAAYMASGVAVGDPDANEATVAGKGYITFVTYPNQAGYYLSGDPMAVATTDDYASLARGRVIDKAAVLAYAVFLQVVDDEVPVNTDGTLDSGFCTYLQQQMENMVNNTMTSNKEIKSVTCYIDPNQNILSTNELNISLSIIPMAYATAINVTLGFVNPAA